MHSRDSRKALSSHFGPTNISKNSLAMSPTPNMQGKETKETKRSILRKTCRLRSLLSRTCAMTGCATPVSMPLIVQEHMSSHLRALP